MAVSTVDGPTNDPGVLRRHYRHKGLVIAAECLCIPWVWVRSETHNKKFNVVEMSSCLGVPLGCLSQ